MVSPDNKTQQADPSHSIDHTVLTKSLSSHVIHDHVGQQPKAWENKDVDFRMPKEPEQMLKQDGIPSPPRVEESGPEVTVQQ